MDASYLIRRVPEPVNGEFALNHPLWDFANELEISQFHPRSSNHRPRTRVRLLYNDRDLFVRFEVDDRYVISKSTHYQDMVCFDSCVEFFFQPKGDYGYFNLETNCGGTFLFYYVEDPTPTPTGLTKFTRISAELAEKITILHSLPSVVLPERTEPTRWSIACRMPFSVLEHYIGPIKELREERWLANFYKCADHSSHPHWASWAPLGEALNFHQPRYFHPVRFE